jgi:hypothetical protein
MARKVAFYLDEVAEKFSPMDILKTMRDHHRKMADDARHIGAQRRRGGTAAAKRLHPVFIMASVEDLDRLAVWFDKQADALKLSMDALAEIAF